MKQTAVDFLKEKLTYVFVNDKSFNELFQQAKEIEKEQIKFFFEKGHLYSGCPYGLDEIYNKTFKSE